MKKSVSKAVDRIHKALKKDVKYYAPMRQRGPVIHTIVDYEPVIVPLGYDHDELAVVCHDDCKLYTLDRAIELLRDGGYTDDDAALCKEIADACSGKFKCTGDDPSDFRWDDLGLGLAASDVLSRYEFENVVDALNSICGYDNDDGYEAVGLLYKPVVDRSAQFLTHAEAERHLRLGSYSKRAHTYCCHIPDGSLLAQLLEAVGPVHH